MLRVGLISPVFGSGFGFHLPDLTSSDEAVSGSARGWIVVQGVDRGGQGVEESPVLGDQQRGGPRAGLGPLAVVEGRRPSVLACSASLGQVAKWQTRTVQVRVSERTWGFNSPLAHPGSFHAQRSPHFRTRDGRLGEGALAVAGNVQDGARRPRRHPRALVCGSRTT